MAVILDSRALRDLPVLSDIDISDRCKARLTLPIQKQCLWILQLQPIDNHSGAGG